MTRSIGIIKNCSYLLTNVRSDEKSLKSLPFIHGLRPKKELLRDTVSLRRRLTRRDKKGI